MSPMRDDELLRDPVIRRAVEARRAAAAQPAPARSRRELIRWLLVGLAIGVTVIVLIDLIQLAG